jgi:hypothetical protein
MRIIQPRLFFWSRPWSPGHVDINEEEDTDQENAFIAYSCCLLVLFFIGSNNHKAVNGENEQDRRDTLNQWVLVHKDDNRGKTHLLE